MIPSLNNMFSRWLLMGFTVLTVILISSGRPAVAANDGLPDSLEIQPVYLKGPGKSVGKVDRVRGEVIIMHADGRYGYRALSGISLYNGDTLFTRADSSLKFSLSDGSNLHLSASTRMVIDKSVYNPKSRNRMSFFRMLAGKARFVVTKLADYKYSRFNVKTASSVVGVRGSDFILEVSQQGGKTVITALDNTILEIIDPANPLQEPVIVTSFQQLETVLGQVMGHPVDVPQDQIMKKLQELGMDDDGSGDQGGGGADGLGGTGDDQDGDKDTDNGDDEYIPEDGQMEDPDQEPEPEPVPPSGPKPPLLDPLPDPKPDDDYIPPPAPLPSLPDMPGHPQ